MCLGIPGKILEIEEDENLERLGNEYGLYLKTTKMFIPRIF